MPTHGASYTVTGSGFGSKDKSAPLLWDDCSHGQAFTTRWTRRYHDTGTLEDYRTVAGAGRSVALPHTHVTKYGCGVTDGVGVDSAAIYFAKEVPKLTEPWWLVFSQYFRVDPNWAFDPGSLDFNFKRMGMSADHAYVGQAPNWYLSYKAGAGNFDSALATPLDYVVQDDATGYGFSINGSSSENTSGSTSNLANPCAAWIKEEIVMRMSSSSAQGRFYFYTDQGQQGWRQHYAFTTNTVTDMAGGTERTVNSGTMFVRDRDTTRNWVFWGDNYIDNDSLSPARIHLTDNATYASSTIFETQPYTSWSPTSITLICNQGKLPDGTAHVHLRDELNGNQYLGTTTLGSAAGGGGGSTAALGRLGGMQVLSRGGR